jgi:crotonobetainyl-CoA:carnitine CoA-transferase CaiB-like acyl-CoA transferase
MKPLEGVKVVNLAVNLPGPAAARRLYQLGAQVTKIEPPGGDPMARFNSRFYEDLKFGHVVFTADLKSAAGRKLLDEELQDSDLLITANRPAALQRLGLGWDDLHARFPGLCQVAIVGYPPPMENEPGHDLTYQAKIGLVSPPHMPRTLIADMAGAEKTVSEGLALLLARERGGGGGYQAVALSDAADYMAEPWKAGFSSPGALVGGALPEYNLYETRDGWVAVAALEPHFKKALYSALECSPDSVEALRPHFLTRTAEEWETWARQRDLPVVAVKVT